MSPADWDIHAVYGGWRAFNRRTGESNDLVRDQSFSAAVSAFEQKIGPYYPTRPSVISST